MTKSHSEFSRKKVSAVFLCIIVVAVCVVFGVKKVAAVTETEDSSKQTDTETIKLTEDQEQTLSNIKQTYNVENQQKISRELDEKKSSDSYTLDNMLIEYNPYGTNTQSLYVYFQTDEAASVSYTVHVGDASISDFSRNAYEEQQYQTEHEFQVIGLIPYMDNAITFYVTHEDGSTDKKEIIYGMGGILGTEEVKLDTDIETDVEILEEGLYVVMGNDSTALDFMYYYDNQGILRGEVPLLGYRSHRLIFDENSVYYSISETKIAQVDRLGQVTNVYDLGQYELHHDYVFDKNGNMLILASDTEQDSVEDIVLKLNVQNGEVTEVLDLGDLFTDYKSSCKETEGEELDWMHINAIQTAGDGSVLLSSRETSSIIKIDNIHDRPQVSYIIGDKSFWDGTEYENQVFNKDGDFTIQGGQHSITYAEDDGLGSGQYYLYLFNNNIGISSTRPDFDWSAVGLTENSAKDGADSYYYKYLVDENSGTFKLIESFELPYSGYVSSVQEIGDNVVTDSGMKGVFQEYDKDNNLIASYKMEMEKFIYRVYKYDFYGFYFARR